jgi:hypothetical protein
MVGFVGAAALAFMLVSVSPDCAEGAGGYD